MLNRRLTEHLDWQHEYHVDADHINLDNVDLFLDHSDFFTLDVAGFIGKPATEEDIQAFINKYEKFEGELSLPVINEKIIMAIFSG